MYFTCATYADLLLLITGEILCDSINSKENIQVGYKNGLRKEL